MNSEGRKEHHFTYFLKIFMGDVPRTPIEEGRKLLVYEGFGSFFPKQLCFSSKFSRITSLEQINSE